MADAIKAPCRRKGRATRTSGKRRYSDIFWVVQHDEEATTALSALHTFESPTAEGSAHLCVDDNVCLRTLENTDIPWAARSAPQISANLHGFHIEWAGFASWTRLLWLFHRRTINRAAYKTAYHCKKFGVPVEFVFASELPHKHGITTHAEITKASKRLDPANAWRYDHTDPGPYWPRRYFMSRVRAYYAELSL